MELWDRAKIKGYPDLSLVITFRKDPYLFIVNHFMPESFFLKLADIPQLCDPFFTG